MQRVNGMSRNAPLAPRFAANSAKEGSGKNNCACDSNKNKDDKLYPCRANASLTASEAALVKSIFGNEIKTTRVRKYFSDKEKPGTKEGFVIPAQTFGEEGIKFYGPNYHSYDYSLATDVFKFGTFIHEMTHIWQNQNKIPCKETPKDSDPYAYALTLQSTFADFSWEQQARIIEDYARMYIYPVNPRQSDPLLQKVVEDRFPEAGRTRLKLEMKERSPAARQPKPD
jgi:hypothetical protein